ncbi:MAG: H-type lectin domain-containing protein [Ignavibacteriaceae bacterium]|nr:H-type lectin domain-containing protein [Ignavibacteriaceae bacterium]
MKKLSLISLFLFFIAGSSFVLAQTAIQSNNFSVGSSTANYTLDKNTGDRSITIEVTFDKPFDKKPTVVLSVTHLDADTKTTVRYDVVASSVSRDGFTIKISTWSETKIFGIGGSWIAYSN